MSDDHFVLEINKVQFNRPTSLSDGPNNGAGISNPRYLEVVFIERVVSRGIGISIESFGLIKSG